jgi:hypothetical protein
VEHVFGSITNEQGGLYFRVIGAARIAIKNWTDEYGLQYASICDFAQDEFVQNSKLDVK